MESDQRKKALIDWLQQIGFASNQLIAMPNDASFRRYFRLQTANTSYVVMDAPLPHENCKPFVAIASALSAQGLRTPEIMAQDLAQGFLVLSDFGDTTFLRALTADNANEHYSTALDALAILQACREVPDWPISRFTSALLQQEWQWHKEWFLGAWLGLTHQDDMSSVDACYQQLIDNVINQPYVFMHRDYHSRNLMLLQHGEVGILDFQDAFIGPVTYDVVSLLRDCYIDWPAQTVLAWTESYWRRLRHLGMLSTISLETFLRWFDWMGLQRHLKALMTFARKAKRDQQTHYLPFIPRTLHYIETVSALYPELKALHQFVTTIVKPAALEKLTCEA